MSLKKLARAVLAIVLFVACGGGEAPTPTTIQGNAGPSLLETLNCRKAYIERNGGFTIGGSNRAPHTFEERQSQLQLEREAEGICG